MHRKIISTYNTIIHDLFAEVLNGPMTQTVPVTQSEAQFTCRARASAVFWYINGETLFNDVPNWIRLHNDDHDFDNVEVTRTISVITPGRNGTKIECLATGADHATDRSAPAFLYIVGKHVCICIIVIISLFANRSPYTCILPHRTVPI